MSDLKQGVSQHHTPKVSVDTTKQNQSYFVLFILYYFNTKIINKKLIFIANKGETISQLANQFSYHF